MVVVVVAYELVAWWSFVVVDRRQMKVWGNMTSSVMQSPKIYYALFISMNS